MLSHGSLFTGIGGLDEGLERAGFFTTWQVEADPFCNYVLEKRWPQVQRRYDVRGSGRANLPWVNLISGGFPCQDISEAGPAGFRGMGLAGERSGLWFDMLRIVDEIRPHWVLVENVSNARKLVAKRLLADLAGAGYSCLDPILLGAWSQGAAHRRERFFVLGYSHQAHAAQLDVGRQYVQEATIRALEEVSQRLGPKCLGFNELVPRDDEPSHDSYSRALRELYGIPNWLDRLRCLGNAVVPQVAEVLGSFIMTMETI